MYSLKFLNLETGSTGQKKSRQQLKEPDCWSVVSGFQATNQTNKQMDSDK